MTPGLKGQPFVEDVLLVKNPRTEHLRWPALDIDLHVDSPVSPDHLPLIASKNKAKNTALRHLMSTF